MAYEQTYLNCLACYYYNNIFKAAEWLNSNVGAIPISEEETVIYGASAHHCRRLVRLHVEEESEHGQQEEIMKRILGNCRSKGCVDKPTLAEYLESIGAIPDSLKQKLNP